MLGQQRCDQTPKGVYFLNQSSDEAPAYFIPLDEARQLKKDKKAWAINHGKDVRLVAELEPGNEDKLAGGTMKDSWHIAESDCYPVWQMYPIGEVTEENAS